MLATLAGETPPPPYTDWAQLADSDARPHYYGAHELAAAERRWNAERRALFAQRPGLPADAMRHIESFLPAGGAARDWYPYVTCFHGRFVPIDRLHEHGEFVCVVRDGARPWWRLTLRHRGLHQIVYQGPVLRGVQYASPPALDTHARLLLSAESPDGNYVRLCVWRVDRHDVERLLLDRYVYGDGLHIAAVPDSGELELTLDKTTEHDPYGVGSKTTYLPTRLG